MVLDCNFHQFFLSLFSIERRLLDAVWVVETGLVGLHDVRHLLKENSVFTFDLCVPSYRATITRVKQRKRDFETLT